MKKITLLLLMMLVGTALVCAQDYIPGVKNLKGEYIDDNKVRLTWTSEEQGPYFSSSDFVTHEKAGYNNYCDVSALHSGLSTLGFNADKDAGCQIMDKLTVNEEVYALRFFLYEGATPFSTISEAYITIYDGDPLSGANVLEGGDGVNRLYGQGNTNIFRVPEDDFSNVNTPVFYTDVQIDCLQDNYEEKTIWYVVSFNGNLKEEDVHIIPRTILGETTTGEARIYTEGTGWQPMLDEGTNTQQGVVVQVIGHGTGGLTPVDSCNIFRNGELLQQIPEDSNESFIDENAPSSNAIYGIQYVYWSWLEGSSEIVNIDVRKSFPPKNFEYDSEEIEDDMIVNHLTWVREDDIFGENIKTFYEIYRKKILEDDYVLIKSIEKVDGQDIYQYDDVTANGTYGAYEYKINTYNVYQTGSSESQFVVAEYAGETISEIESKSINVIPTVFSNNESVSVESDSDIKDVRMIDMLGRNVNVSMNQANDTSCEISINQRCNSGVYLIVVETQNGSYYEKVILR